MKRGKIIVTVMVVVLIIELICFGLVFMRAGGENSWQEQYDLGVRYLSEGNYEEAVLCFLAAVDIDPRRTEAYLGAAESYVALGDTESAAAILAQGAEETGDEGLIQQLGALMQGEQLIDSVVSPGNETAPENGPEQETRQQTEPETIPLPAVATLTDAFSDQMTVNFWEDQVCCYHIPQIQLSSGSAAAANEAIYEELYAVFADQVYGSNEEYGYPFLSEMTYAWTQKEELVSVVAMTRTMTYEWWDYYVYTFSTETGDLVSAEDVIAAYGLTEEEFYALVREKLEAYFVEIYQNAFEWEGNNDYFYEFYYEQLEKTISDDNVRMAIPYIDGNGDLCIVADVYSLAAADHYQHLINLTGTAEPEDPQCPGTHAQ